MPYKSYNVTYRQIHNMDISNLCKIINQTSSRQVLNIRGFKIIHVNCYAKGLKLIRLR